MILIIVEIGYNYNRVVGWFHIQNLLNVDCHGVEEQPCFVTMRNKQHYKLVCMILYWMVTIEVATDTI